MIITTMMSNAKYLFEFTQKVYGLFLENYTSIYANTANSGTLVTAMNNYSCSHLPCE